jgi:hypothetical protein
MPLSPHAGATCIIVPEHTAAASPGQGDSSTEDDGKEHIAEIACG